MPYQCVYTGKNNRFAMLDILPVFKEYPKKSQIWQSETSPIREFSTKFPGWDLSHSSTLPFLWVFFKIKFFPVICYL